jgi:hypothetical protein
VLEDGSYFTEEGWVSARDTYNFNASNHRTENSENDVTKVRKFAQRHNLLEFETWTKKYKIEADADSYEERHTGSVRLIDQRYDPPNGYDLFVEGDGL